MNLSTFKRKNTICRTLQFIREFIDHIADRARDLPLRLRFLIKSVSSNEFWSESKHVQKIIKAYRAQSKRCVRKHRLEERKPNSHKTPAILNQYLHDKPAVSRMESNGSNANSRTRTWYKHFQDGGRGEEEKCIILR